MAIDSSCRTVAQRARRSLAGGVFLAAWCAAPAAADLWVKERVTGGDGKSLGERTWTIASDRVRLDAAGGGFLLDASAGKGWRYVAGGACTALGVPRAEAAPARHGEEAGRLATIAGELGGGSGIAPKTTSEARTIAGAEAKRVDFARGGETIEERWFAASVENAELDALIERWHTSGRLHTLMALDEAQIAIHSLGRGYPVRVKNHRTGVVFEAVEIKTSAQPASAFIPPAGCPGR